MTALVVATFVTRYRIPIGGFHFLPEDFIAIGLLVHLALHGKSSAIFRAISDRTVLLLGLYVVWQSMISLLQAPNSAMSLRVDGWLALDWLLLVAVLAAWEGPARLERIAAVATTWLAVLALVLWLAYVGIGSTLGTQGGYGSGRAAFALSWESNILASTLAVWAFVCLTSQNQRVKRTMKLGAPLALLAIGASYTRAGVIGFVTGLVIWIAWERRSATRTVMQLIAAGIVVAALVVTVAPKATQLLDSRFSTLVAFDSGTAAIRRQSVEVALGDLHGANVLVGHGSEAFGQFHTSPWEPGQPWYIGELPVQLLYEGGLIGVLLLCLALASLRPFSRKHPGRAVGAIAIYLFAASATSPFWFGWTWILIALAIMTRPGANLTAVDDTGTY
jgi:hypothetical protein